MLHPGDGGGNGAEEQGKEDLYPDEQHHGDEVDHGARVQDPRQVPCLQNAPEGVGDVVAHHTHKKTAVVPLRRRKGGAVPGPEQIAVDNQQNDHRQDPDD